MKTYSLSFRYSKDGVHFTMSNTSIKAESESEAIEILKSRYPYVENIRVQNVH